MSAVAKEAAVATAGVISAVAATVSMKTLVFVVTLTGTITPAAPI
jgi:hypothetical protein